MRENGEAQRSPGVRGTPVHAAILSYHQVDAPHRDDPRNTLVLSPVKFDLQLSTLHALGWKGLSLRDLEPYLAGDKRGRVFGITLDDGYKNNLTYALPVLRRLGFTATVFMVSGHIGGSNAWDRDHVAPAALMDVRELTAWTQAGMEVGAHTRTHPRLPNCGTTIAQEEIAGCKTDLEDALGVPIERFSYPHGLFAPAHVEMVREAGYLAAVTTRTARASTEDDPLRLPRISVHSHTSILRLVLQVTTGFEEWRAEQRRSRAGLPDPSGTASDLAV